MTGAPDILNGFMAISDVPKLTASIQLRKDLRTVAPFTPPGYFEPMRIHQRIHQKVFLRGLNRAFRDSEYVKPVEDHYSLN